MCLLCWSMQTGNCLLTITHHAHPVTAAGWAPDGQSFVTSSLDSKSSLCHWSMRGSSLHTWKDGFRTQDCAISPDGRRIVAADTAAKIHVFDFNTHEKEYSLALQSKATSVTISQDSKHMLVNLADGEIQLIDMDTTAVVRRFRGHQQGNFVIRSVFGGAAENFVVSGSEGNSFLAYKKPFSCDDRKLTITFRFQDLCLAQGERDTGRNARSSHQGMCKLNIMEPCEPWHVCVCR